MTATKKTIRIDLTTKSLADAVAVLNAVFAARHVLEQQGLKVYIRKKKPAQKP